MDQTFFLAKNAGIFCRNSKASRKIEWRCWRSGPTAGRRCRVECELVGFIQFICILILKFKTRPNTSLCEIEQRERKPACSGPGVRLGKTLYKAEAGNITKYQQNSYEHLKCSRKKILISMFMSASNANGHIYVEIKLRQRRDRPPTTDIK